MSSPSPPPVRRRSSIFKPKSPGRRRSLTAENDNREQKENCEPIQTYMEKLRKERLDWKSLHADRKVTARDLKRKIALEEGRGEIDQETLLELVSDDMKQFLTERPNLKAIKQEMIDFCHERDYMIQLNDMLIESDCKFTDYVKEKSDHVKRQILERSVVFK